MRPKKRFGQHFLVDHSVLNQMRTTIAPASDQRFVEIGPGQGVLTDLIVPSCRAITLIEIDRDLCAQLRIKYMDDTHVSLREQDALQLDLSAEEHDIRLIGNLPYNISTQLILNACHQRARVIDMHFLVQKEVGDRLCASVGDAKYGRLSVMVQYYCDVTPCFDVLPDAFDPPPKVDSSFVCLKPKQDLLSLNSFSQFEAIVREAFSYRRKTIANALKKYFTAETLTAAGVDPRLRAQSISLQQYVRLANSL